MRIIHKFLPLLLCVLILSAGWSPTYYAQDKIQLPNWDDFEGNISVTDVISNAWNDTIDYNREQGGWIFQNTTTGELKVVRITGGSNVKIKVPFPEPEDGWRAVGFFHTHPRYGEGDGRGLSDTDLDPNNSLDVPELMWDEDGWHTFGPERGIFDRTPMPELNIRISPSSAIIILDKTHMPTLNVLIDDQPIDIQKYRCEWELWGSVVNKLISTEPALTEKVFLQSIGSKPGEYLVYMFVIDKATGKRAGYEVAKVTVRKNVNHWVSAVQGKGLIFHQKAGEWGEKDGIPQPGSPELVENWDVDLLVTDTTGSLTLTLTSTTDLMPGRIGTKRVLSINNYKDDGKTISFNLVSESGTSTMQLTYATNGHLTAHKIYPATAGVTEAEETWDMIPAIE